MSKKKKEKITYIDDGRTIADMSALSGGKTTRPKTYGGYRGSVKEKWSTYWGAVKMMFVPMLVVVIALILLYLMMYVIFGLA